MKIIMAKTWRRLILAIKFFTAKRVMSDASALTYSTLLAIVPVMAVVFAVARGFGYSKYIETWFRDAFSSQPAVADTLIGFVNSYLIHTQSSIFLGVGLVVMLYPVLLLVMNPIAIVLMSGLSFFFANITALIPYVSVLTPTVKLLINLSPFVIMSLMFIGLYVFMPNTHVRLSHCIAPGILAGVAMQILQFAYINSQIWVSSYNAIYGSFAALPMFMLWIQISWIICLFGAELCYTSQNVDFFDFNTSVEDISHRYKLMLSAMILSCMCKQHDKGGRPYTNEELRDKTQIPIRIVNELLYNMQQARLVCEISGDEKGEQTRFVPAISGDKMTFGIMIDRLESQGKWKIKLPENTIKSEIWRKAIKLRTCFLYSARDIKLRDL